MRTSDVIKDLIGNRSIKQFSEYSGIPENSLHNWLKGRSEPSFFNVVAVANACGYRLKFEEITGDKNVY